MAELHPDSSEPRALNAPIEVALDGPIDPVSVTAASVKVVRADGSDVPAVVSVSAGSIRVELAVTHDSMVEALPAVWLELAGLPSPAALRTLDGRCLRSSVRRAVPVLAELRAASPAPPRLVSVNGVATSELGAELNWTGELVLTFSGVLDHATISPLTCPLFPVAGDLTLPSALAPVVRWRCVGQRFDLILSLPAASGRLHCILRRLAVRDHAGAAPEPAGFSLQLLPS